MASPYDDFRKNWLKFGGTGGATGTYTDPNNTAIYSDENLDDVRAAMAFDQADVDRRWNLAMGDYRVREEDQNQFRASQGMENKKSNFTV